MSRSGPDVVIDNGLITVTIDSTGQIASLFDHRAGREVVIAGERANRLELSGDHPVEYDAWDLDHYYAESTVGIDTVDEIAVIEQGPLVASVRVSRSFSMSSIVQQIVVRAGSARVDIVNDVAWHEDEKVLKVAMPLDVRADRAACEIQFGHVDRPTHASTSWDAAKFEVCAHRFVDVSEQGYGVALLNDGKYGYDIQRGALRLTLLRATSFPDPAADRGDHHFSYALFPHLGGLAEGDVVGEAARLNQPVVALRGRLAAGGDLPTSVTAVTSSDPRVVVSAVKLAEDSSGDVIVRCYESAGGRRSTTLTTGFEFTRAAVNDLLERELADTSTAVVWDSTGVSVEMRPFQIVTLRLQR